MNTITLSATAIRNNFFDLLDKVVLGSNVVIRRNNKDIAMIVHKTSNNNWENFIKKSREVNGILKDYTVDDNLMRREGSSDFLGKWDKK